MAAPKRRIAGIAASIPAGYVLGRTQGGEGDVGLISISELGQNMVASGAVVAGGGGSAVTIAAGSGIGVAGGPAYTISNTGVLSNIAGSGISVSGATGNVTIGNTGVLSLTAPAAGFTVNAATGAITFTLANDLAALEGLGSTGLAARTASDTWAQRTITGTSNRLTVTNGDGVSGNPTLDISSAYVGQNTITTLGTIGTGTWQGTIIAGLYGGTGVANSGKTITLGGNLTTSGAFGTTITVTATTNSTLPAGTHTLAGLDVAQTFTATQKIRDTGTDADFIIGAWTPSTAYTVLSFNGLTTAGTMGFYAAATTDPGHLYYNVPTGGAHGFRVQNSANIATIDAAGLALSIALAKTSGGTGVAVALAGPSTFQPANPASSTTATTFKHQGFGSTASFTPAATGKLIITVTGSVQQGTAADGSAGKIRYGTGTAPALGDAETGTQAGANFAITTYAGAFDAILFTLVGTVSGLSVGTAYWIDMAAECITGGSTFLGNVNIVVQEVY